MFAVGLTGGIGSGKSAVSAQLAHAGAGVIDSDLIAHRLTGPGGAAIEPIRHAFGAQLITADGALDRPHLRDLVFTDAGARQQLEAILHPRIRAVCEEQAAAIAPGVPYLVFVVPLLVESGSWRARVDRVLVIDSPVHAQLARITTARGLAPDLAARIVAQQATRQARLAAADDVLFNDGPLPALAPRVARLHRYYLAMAASGQRSPDL